MTHRHLFCFGLGYSAQHLAASLADDGWKVSGTVRNADAIPKFEAMGWRVYTFDGTSPLVDATARLTDATHIVDSIPPGTDGDPVLLHHGADIAELSELTWLAYLSTTGVYGD